MMLAAIEWNKVGELLWAAPLAALVLSLAFAFVVLGTARADDARRHGATATAALYGALAIVCAGAFFVLVGYGIHIITNK
jgi:hypothetical protein